MPTSARSPRQRGDRDDDDGERRGERDQRPRALVVVERVGRGSGLVDLAADADVVAGRERRLAGSAAELEHRLGVGVGPGFDGDERVRCTARPWPAPVSRCSSITAPTSAPPQSALPVDSTCPGLGGDRTARGVLERQRDVDLLLARPQQGGACHDRDADGHQDADDDLRGQRSERRRTVQGVRVGVRVRHPDEGRGSTCTRSYCR